MPEIAEVARVTHFLRQHLVGKRIGRVAAADDGSVFGKAGTSGAAFAAALAGRRVVAAGRQGKYFWLELDAPPHPVLHLGMTGWVHVRGVPTAYNRYAERADKEAWPPKYWKFHLTASADADADGEDRQSKEGEDADANANADADDGEVSVAFTDARRFGRIRLVDCAGADIRSHSPLIENGPDPVVDRARFTGAYLAARLKGRRVPVKALLLDQAVLSGVGNWVGDEILYHARLHPERHAGDLSDAEVAALYASICAVCDTAVGVLGDSDQFPPDWLFHHRWGKGKKDAATVLPSGEKIIFLTVGGRTSCVVPSRQKKTGCITAGVKEEEEGSEPEPAEVKTIMKEEKNKGKEIRKKKSRFFNGDVDADTDADADANADVNMNDRKAEPEARPFKRPRKSTQQAVKKEGEEDEPALADQGESMPKKGGRKTAAKPTTSSPLDTGRRRSARLSKPLS
ncbi:putative formamidopyrimidine-DNA glycosylase [Rosellinia necatrix]|uniref:Putative formamidopyrimidine-DNA glycosylase n=1 Tax=Rosellinia necatrix TaxID=77044 RepID=A0A1W2TRW5_ROSNE|nr:putative formamidopyrimidine-DNA glycosylase [Rosellinia necatrix]